VRGSNLLEDTLDCATRSAVLGFAIRGFASFATGEAHVVVKQVEFTSVQQDWMLDRMMIQRTGTTTRCHEHYQQMILH
jgi:hypothetical protein